jgi:predicted MFS family arabinose efflux permease
VTVATAGVDRRRMLCAFMFLLAAANGIAAAAPAYWAVLLSRVLVGIVIGGFWSIGAGLAGRLVPARSAGRATAVVFSAVPLGSVVGVPLGTLIGDLAGWRAGFLMPGALSAAVLVALVVLLPPLPAERAARLGVLRGMLRGAGTRSALLLTFLIVLAHFGAYTYVTPFLEEVTEVSSARITLFLLVYGAAGVAGTFLAGTVAARRPHAAFGAAGALIAVAVLALPFLGRTEPGALLLLVVWGIGYGAVPVCSQACFTRAAPESPEAASVLFTASFQATLSSGALVGGVVLDHTSVRTVMLLGGATAAAMVAATALLGRVTGGGGKSGESIPG